MTDGTSLIVITAALIAFSWFVKTNGFLSFMFLKVGVFTLGLTFALVALGYHDYHIDDNWMPAKNSIISQYTK